MKLNTLTAMAALLAVGPSFAHEAQKGPNGGRVAEAGDYHVELVPKGGAVEVFITDNKEPSAPAGFKGVAILLVDGKQQRITLESPAPGRLTGKASVTPQAVVKGVVQLTSPQGTSLMARFQ
jgi:hypothetical protein